MARPMPRPPPVTNATMDLSIRSKWGRNKFHEPDYKIFTARAASSATDD